MSPSPRVLRPAGGRRHTLWRERHANVAGSDGKRYGHEGARDLGRAHRHGHGAERLPATQTGACSRSAVRRRTQHGALVRASTDARAQFVSRAAATIGRGWACSTAVSAGDSSMRCLRAETREVDGTNSGKPSEDRFHGNPEPSRRYTGGRCRDYLRARAPLITGWSVPHPHAPGAVRG